MNTALIRPRLKVVTGALSASEWGRVAGMALTIFALNALGWAIFILVVLPHHFRYDQQLGVGIGVAFTAWTLGIRHAFDADHISAIDNVTRSLMASGKRPLGTGFFFALGHSSMVFAVGVGMSVAAKQVFGAVVNPDSTYESVAGTAGTLIAALFLYLVAGMNFIVLRNIAKVFKGMRAGSFTEEELERQLNSRGVMARLFGRFLRSVDKTWQMYFVGMIFGIGFETASEVILLSATAFGAASGLPFYAILALPLLFAGGMTLFDTIDGCFMNFAYGWAFARPVRKVYYNLVVTGLSVGAAFLIGTIEVLGLLKERLKLRGGFWDFMAAFDINKAGFIIAALFVLVWVLAIAIWRYGHVESRWSTAETPDPS